MTPERTRLDVDDYGTVRLLIDRLDPGHGWDYDRSVRLGELGDCDVPDEHRAEYERILANENATPSRRELHREWEATYRAMQG
jgi:hypothetical protein